MDPDRTSAMADAAFDVELWHDFMVMIGGVAGALIGLLFVAISINLDRIVSGANLPRRALETLAVLMTVLTIAALGLIPQSARALGVETLLLAAGVVGLLVSRWRQPSSAGSRLRRDVPLGVLIAFAVPLTAAAVTVLVGAGGGLYWLVPTVVVGFTGAVLNAWVLLVEIVR